MEMKLDYSDISFRNDGRLKLLIIVGTRPEIIRLAAVIQKCRKYFDCLLAHTGQNYDYNLNGIFFRDLGLDAGRDLKPPGQARLLRCPVLGRGEKAGAGNRRTDPGGDGGH